MLRTNPYRLARLAIFCVLIPSGFAQSDEVAVRDKLNKKIDNFILSDASGKKRALHDLKDKKAIVIVFLSFDCPVSTAYLPLLSEMAKAGESKSIAFVGINSSDDLDAATLKKKAAEFKLFFPVLNDPNHTAADAFKAETVPSVFVLDGNFVLRYRGRIDDGYAARLKPARVVQSHDLRDALADVLAGREVRTPARNVVGCPIPRAREAAKTGKVQYHRDVLPILQNHCQQCHRPGEVGPFSLMTYKQAVNWASDIKEFTRSRKMPPWKPVEGLPFHGERKLSDKEIATLAAWVDGGTPEGDPATAPAPRRFVEGWQLGKPDLVLTVEDDFQLAANGSDLYRCFVLPTNLPEDRYISAVEVRPGNPRIVHHAVLFSDTQGRARRFEKRLQGKNLEKGDAGPGYSVPMSLSFLPGFLPSTGLGGWAPGQVVHLLPEDSGYYLPRGADLILQLHYYRSGQPEKDRTSIGLYFAKKTADRRVQGVVVPGHFLFIPAKNKRFQVKGSIWVQNDCHLHGVFPHMHLVGKEIKVTMTPPGGKPQTLLAITDWEFNWQQTYYLKKALPVKAGTRFDVEATYDNSADNPANPHRPPRTIFTGLMTTNEMCLGGLFMTPDKPGRIRFDVQPRIQGLNWAPTWGIPFWAI